MGPRTWISLHFLLIRSLTGHVYTGNLGRCASGSDAHGRRPTSPVPYTALWAGLDVIHPSFLPFFRPSFIPSVLPSFRPSFLSSFLLSILRLPWQLQLQDDSSAGMGSRWVQNESLPALYRLYGLTGDPKYLKMIQGTLEWIRNFQTDHEFGEQYWVGPP